MDELLESLYTDINPIDTKYAFYGHSLGALLAYLMALKMRHANKTLPSHLFLSGRGGPGVYDDKEKRHLLPKDEFRSMLIKLGGMPKEVLEDDTLMEFFEPIIRADFELLESYSYAPGEKLNIPISVFIGDREETTKEEALQWQNETTLPIRLRVMSGDHFFIFDQCKELVAEMTKALNSNQFPTG